jgi:hypothetical protein
MPTYNLVVRVRAGQMNRPDTRIDDPLRMPDRNHLFLLNLLTPGEWPCPEMSVAPAAVQPN